MINQNIKSFLILREGFLPITSSMMKEGLEKRRRKKMAIGIIIYNFGEERYSGNAKNPEGILPLEYGATVVWRSPILFLSEGVSIYNKESFL